MVQEVEYFKNELTECVNMIMMKSLALRKPIIAISALIASVAIFGCTVQQGKSLLTSQTSDADVATAVLDKVPFAYDVAVDTISYNSCVGIGLNASDYIHGIKIGANEGFVDTAGSGAVKAGVKLKSEFLQYLAKNVPPNFPNTSVSSSQIKYILENSTANKELQIQFAVRTTADLKVVQDIIQPSSTGNIVFGRDGLYMSPVLSQDPILTAITQSVQFGPAGSVLSEGPRVYNLGSKSGPVALEASLGYSSSSDESFPPVATADDGQGVGEQYSDIVRSKFNSFNYVLAVTFGNQTLTSSSDSTPSFGLNSLRRPSETDLRKAYGRSYELSFATKNAGLSSWKKNYLNRVTEKNLEDGRTVSGASWTCDNFVIVKQNQLNNRKASEPSCTELIASDLTNATVAAKVKLIRRHYGEDKWTIGLFYKKNTTYSVATRVFENAPTNTIARPLCIVSKAADCYLPTTGIVLSNLTEDIGVQYDPSFECYLSRAPQMGVTYTGGLSGAAAQRLGRCAQYASICSRASTSF
ncbi:MAG: hypothetical protein ABL930_00030 [Pseudobdellovibrio sp.]